MKLIKLEVRGRGPKWDISYFFLPEEYTNENIVDEVGSRLDFDPMNAIFYNKSFKWSIITDEAERVKVIKDKIEKMYSEIDSIEENIAELQGMLL